MSYDRKRHVCHGRANCFVDGECYPVREGDIMVFNSGAVHGWEMEEDVELLVLTFSEKIITSDRYIDGEILNFSRIKEITYRKDGWKNQLE